MLLCAIEERKFGVKDNEMLGQKVGVTVLYKENSVSFTEKW